jgi:guanylate kinase
MGKIVLLIGKSTTGKDTIYKRLLKDNKYGLKKVILYTTRPMRKDESDGDQYYFVSEASYREMKENGKIIEERTYDTAYGPWRYFTADDSQIDLDNYSVLMIGTLESLISVRSYFGEQNVIPVYIEVPDKVRIERALRRENRQEHPRYDEMCRRYLADEVDFAESKIKNAGIDKRFSNDRTLEECLLDISNYLEQKL